MNAADRFRRADALFDAALDLPPDERAAFVDREAADDAALRTDVLRLLRAHDRSAGFLATPAAVLGASLISGAEDADDVARLQRAIGDDYTIERVIGTGGMATVYLATDVRHGRPVAVKRLSPSLGALLGAERFLAEIRVMAGLQHPNLLPLFDSGGAGDVLYYVMPYVDGETLRDRLRRDGRLPVREAVRIAVAIAGALDHAHRRGVVHRDLKPENVLLHDGEPLVADFGIALATTAAGGERLTRAGALLGTARYMSPEQAAGTAVDARSDVYSLGIVLYEMLVGRTPDADDPTTAAAVRAAGAPPAVARATARALARRPADRFASAGELAHALGSRGGVAAWLPLEGRRLLWAAAGGVALIGTGAAAWRLAAAHREAPRTARFIVGTDADPAQGPLAGRLTITPDGRSFVYTGAAAAGHPVLVRPVDALEARALPGTAGAFGPFVSPDAKWVGFFSSDDKLEKVPIDGGAPTVLAGVFRFSTARWGPGGVIVLDAYGQPGLAWVRDAGGPLHPLTRFDSTAGELRHGAPLILPDGHTVVFTVGQRFGPGPDEGVLAVATLDTAAAGPARHVSLGIAARAAVAVVDGWLLYVARDGRSLRAVRFDAATGRASGPSVTVLETPDGDIGDAQLSDDGTLVYTHRTVATVPVLVSATGERTPLLGDIGAGEAGVMNPRLSPDGRRLAIMRSGAQGTDVWIYDLATRTPTRLTSTGNAVGPTWTPDGRRIVFVSNAGGSEALWWQPADGSAPAERLVSAPGAFAATVTPDGRTLLFQRQLDGVWGIWSASLGGDRVARPVLRERFDDYMPAVSPDGRWLAYASNATGRYEVYVRPFPGPGAAVQLSTAGGTEPAWSPDGRRLFYRAERRLQSATVATVPAFAVTARSTLFADDFGGEMPHVNYAVAADGRHFVMVGAPTSAGPETVVVLDWVSELRGKLR